MDAKDVKDPEAVPVPGAEEGLAGDLTTRVLDHAAERALCRRFDLRLLPVLAIMYLFNSLDKGNLGNAKTDGFEKDLHFHGNQYNILLSVFYAPYVLCAPPFAMLGKRYGPNKGITIMMLVFGSMTLLSASVSNFGGMMAVRWFLGMAEAAFFPLVIYYLTTFYRRGELARRLAVFYAASNIANAFSGLLAFGVFHIRSTSLAGWRYLFLIEGACTFLFAIFAFFYLPKSAATARFLSPEEKELAHHRIEVDSSSVVDEKLDWRDAITVFKLPVVWVWLAIEMCIGVPLQSVSNFLPQIVGALDYSTVKTNLYTVAPSVTGAVMLLLLAFASDWTKLRFPFITLGFAFPFIGFLAYAGIDVLNQTNVAYFLTFMMCWGTSAPSVLLSTWYNNNIAQEGKRIALTSIGVPVANVMGIVSSNIFRNQDAPKYFPALITTAAFGGVGIVLTFSLGVWMVFDNKKRNKRQGINVKAQDVPTKILRDGPISEDFRWFL